MEILVTIVTEIGKCLCVRVGREIGYVAHSNTNALNLRNQVQELGTMREEVQVSLNLAHERGEVIKPTVEAWVTKVDGIKEDAAKVDDEVNENRRCFSGWCPSLRSRYKIGKEAEKKMVVVKALQQEGKFSVVSDPPPHLTIDSIPTGDFADFESTKSAMEQVMTALKKEEVSIVGVYGLGGVGKTTLVEQVGKQMKKNKDFNEVIMVAVSQTVDLKRIQCEIAENLGLKFLEDSKRIRAGRLCQRLKEEGTVLLIFDDIWEEIELREIGIPPLSEHKGCKIILTSRSLDVCNQMMSQVTINVQVLSDSDSWVLFKSKTGDFIESPLFRNVAVDVVKECGGLPIAIVTLGKALRGKTISYWNDSLVTLKRSIGMDQKLFNSLVISYKALENEETKLCFLFCCLFPEDSNIEIEALIRYGMGERFCKNVFTLVEARVRCRTSVDNLKASCLLLEGDREGTVKMHDVIRDLAIKISSEDEHKFLVKAGQGLERWPESEEVDKFYRVSLVHNHIRMLPDRPELQKLRTLLLSHNWLYKIPNDFFEGLKTLTVLDLSFNGISLLPSSLSCLINLRTLCLDNCQRLEDFSFLGRLKNLEILSLKHSSIRKLPEEIGELTNLKLLDLTDTSNLEVAPNVISRLTLLEELHMTNSFRKWHIGKGHDESKASFSEVASLPYLTVLNIDVGNTEILSQDISGPWRKLTEFCLRISYLNLDPPAGRRHMHLKISDPIANWVMDLAKRTEDLSLAVWDNFENAEPLFNREASGFLANLRVLKVVSCNELVTLLPTNLLQRVQNLENISVMHCGGLQEVFATTMTGEEGDAILTKLTRMYLDNLKNLTTIWKGHIPLGSLHSLKQLTVVYCESLLYLLSPSLEQTMEQLVSISVVWCEKMEGLISREEKEREVMEPKLIPPVSTFQNLQFLNINSCHSFKYILSWKVACGLKHLKNLKLSHCDGMEVIIGEEEDMGMVDSTVLPQLKTIFLYKLPRLGSFCGGEILLHMASLEDVTVLDCSNLKRLSLGPQSAPKLKKIKAQKEWFEELERADESIPKSLLQSVFKEYDSDSSDSD